MIDVMKYVRWIALGCIFAMPALVLYVSHWSFFPYIVGKNLLFRALVELAFGSWILLVLFGSIPRPRLTPIRLAVGIFVAVVALADAFGTAPFKSFWGNFERMDGFVTLVHALMYFIVAGSLLTGEKLWLRFWQWSLIISVFVGFGALGELGKEGARIAGTTGNPIYLAVYALFHIFIGIFVALRARVHNGLLAGVWGGVALFNVMVLWFTGTRGALLGLIAGVLVVGFGLALFARGREYRVARYIAGGLIGIIALSVGAFFVVKDTQWGQESTMIHRLTQVGQISELDRSTSALRVMVWRTAWEGVKERPVLGWGQENFNYVFAKYYNPHMYWAEQWYDRTHNLFFDWLIAAGVFGLLAYLALYLTVFIEVLRSGVFSVVEKALLSGLLAGYFVHNMFVFDHIVSYILFFSLMAWVHSVSRSVLGDDDGASLMHIGGKIPQAIALIVVSVGTLVLVYFVNFPAYMQSKTLIKAMVTARAPQHAVAARELFLDADAYNALGTQEVREQFTTAARLMKNVKVSDKDRARFVATAIAQMRKQHERYPQDPRFPYFIYTVYSAYGDYDEATKWLDTALKLAPNKIAFLMQQGHNAAYRNKLDMALQYYKRALELAPENKKAAKMVKVTQEALAEQGK